MNKTSFPLRGGYALLSEPAVDDFIDLDRLWVMARRRLWMVALGALAGLLLGLVYLQMAPPSFTAQTQVLIDESLGASTGETVPAASSLQTDSAILSRIEVLKSVRLALAVVDAEGLAHDPVFMNPPPSAKEQILAPMRAATGLFRGADGAPAEVSGGGGATGDDLGSPERHRAAGLLRERLSVDRVGRSYVIAIGYASHDPALAWRVTRAYTTAFFADQLVANENASGEATKWMQTRLAELGEQQREAALAVESYRAQNNLSVASGELTSEQRLTQLTGQLVVVQGEFAAAQARSRQLDAIVAGGVEAAVGSNSLPADQTEDPVVSALRTRYLAVDRRLGEVVGRWGDDHPQAVGLRREREEISRQLFGEIQGLARAYRNDLDVARNRQEALGAAVAEQTGLNVASNQSMVRLRELEQHSAILNTLYGNLLSRYENVLQKQTAPVATMRVISEASLPESASGPRFVPTMALSLVFGLFAGCVAGAIGEFNERFFRVGADIRRELGLKFLGYLPLTGKRQGFGVRGGSPPAGQLLRAVSDASASLFAETLRNAKIAVNAALPDTSAKVIGIVSALPDEGKSTFAANFAELLALNGFETLLVDADLRKPGLTRLLYPETTAGLVEATLGTPWREVVREGGQRNLRILPSTASGDVVFGSEILSGAGMQTLLVELRQHFDYIVVDLPPIGPVVDAKAFEPLADCFLLVVRWGRTPRALLRSILGAEPELTGKIAGAVLNQTDIDALVRFGSRGGEEEAQKAYRKYYVERD